MNSRTRADRPRSRGAFPVRSLLTCCLTLVASATCAAQQQKPPRPERTAEQQNAEAVLDRVSGRIKDLDEPTVRVFLRLQVAAFLWQRGPAVASRDAEAVSTEALADLQKSRERIPTLYANMFRSQLLALTQKYAPELAARLAEHDDLNQANAGPVAAIAMLDDKATAARAVEIMDQNIIKGQIPPTTEFFLDKLSEVNPAEAARLLGELLTAEERQPGTLSWEMLFFLKHLYVSEKTPPAVQIGFLTLLVNRARSAQALPPQDRELAQRLLAITLPAIQKLRPDLYAQAAAQAASISVSSRPADSAREDAAKRIEQSADPLEQMVTEADATKDPAYRERLLTDAAQKALGQGRLKRALELVGKVESKEKEFPLWRDQFLGQLADRALKEDDIDLADEAVSRIESPLSRASAAQREAVHIYRANDTPGALARLNASLRLIESAADAPDKVAAFLKSVPACREIDGQRARAVAREAVKAINALPGPRPGDEPASDAYKLYVSKTLMPVVWFVVPAFRDLAKGDEPDAYSIAEDISSREIKTAAVLGAATATRAAVDAPPAGRRN